MSLRATIESLLRELYVAPYRRALGQAWRDEDDLFLLFVFSEALGVPSPMGLHALELMPLVYERFHAWHKRMGMPRSPLDGLRCC